MIEVIRYDTLEECLAEFFEESPGTVLDGKCSWTDGGPEHKWSMRRFARSCRKRGVWGFCENKKVIHAWIADHAKPETIIRLLAHELGHMQRPFKKSHQKEEAKAEQYSAVAKTAFQIMEKLRGEKRE